MNPAEPTARALITGPGTYKQLQVDREGTQLAFISNRDALAQQAAAKKNAKKDDKAAEVPAAYQVFFWRAKDAAAQVLVNAATSGMPAGGARASMHRSASARTVSACSSVRQSFPRPSPRTRRSR